MTYAEFPFPPISYQSSPIQVIRARGHPLQPIEGAWTFVVEGFVDREDVEAFVKEMFGLATLGFRRYLLKPGDRVVWRALGATPSKDCLLLDVNHEGYPHREAALEVQKLPKPSLSIEDLGLSALLCSHVDDGRPGPILVDGQEEYEVEKIVDEGVPTGINDVAVTLHYHIRWKGWSPHSDSWIPAKDAEKLEALDQWLGV
ncbi:hypothetical protein BKA70DRAFT_1449336 [Coprinopsis sp. MPI-PUGE-AT-0042]|nr:hypothetical protein BKA70DRAFT_1449336 [Coprinopsis sp. MPI-PUGE-AT-0042]